MLGLRKRKAKLLCETRRASVGIVGLILCLVINMVLIKAIRPETKLGDAEQCLYVTDKLINSILSEKKIE